MNRNGSHTIRRVWDVDNGAPLTATGLEGYVVYISDPAGDVHVVNGATEEPLGIIAGVSDDGLSVDIVLPGGVTNARYGAAVPANTLKLMADASGQLIPYVSAAGNYCCAWHLNAAVGADNDVFEVLVRSELDITDGGSV